MYKIYVPFFLNPGFVCFLKGSKGVFENNWEYLNLNCVFNYVREFHKCNNGTMII